MTRRIAELALALCLLPTTLACGGPRLARGGSPAYHVHVGGGRLTITPEPGTRCFSPGFPDAQPALAFDVNADRDRIWSCARGIRRHSERVAETLQRDCVARAGGDRAAGAVACGSGENAEPCSGGR